MIYVIFLASETSAAIWSIVEDPVKNEKKINPSRDVRDFLCLLTTPA